MRHEGGRWRFLGPPFPKAFWMLSTQVLHSTSPGQRGPDMGLPGMGSALVLDSAPPQRLSRPGSIRPGCPIRDAGCTREDVSSSGSIYMKASCLAAGLTACQLGHVHFHLTLCSVKGDLGFQAGSWPRKEPCSSLFI